MNKQEFERFLAIVAKQIKPDEPNSDKFDQGYAMGKMLAQMLKGMSDTEKHDFQDGMDVGASIEAARPERIH
jgi:hypothetical protein